ncbi:PLP-dependent aminotransferase family protein [Actinomycetospora sp. TBRC 11914]|uniref:MocR-like pyridoxine biosynthesis transcription factor PdxR n=1 Tax=Actinomycetospora sp. TBRC 11914 TaxID=2729387 RepID=UPI00145EB78D|nr:PLP-dependent aminotransferase family protein [Actinomycetospora sp. TBRC 11914]NMO91156.1 PLP-dependent aminotransferase family protein [Actinomycetospora sp. TBRC 11914]
MASAVSSVVVGLDRAAGVPLAVQLADALRRAALDGRLRPGDRVPATRVLARELGVSRTVTTAAYDQLVAEGWLGARHGSGTVVTAAPPSSVASVASGASLLASSDRKAPSSIDLRPGAPCLEVLDTAAWQRAWRRAGDLEPAERPEHAGAEAYRAAVAEHLLRHRGVPAAPGELLATAGTTAGFTEVLGVLRASRGRPLRVGVEDPGYRRAAGVVRAGGDEVVGLPVDADGLVVGAVPTGLDVVVVSPAHQYPLGGRLPVARRGELVDRARVEGFVVVEDDYDGELRYDVAPLPVLAALAPDVVVHLGTASKIATPTLGVGWMAAPPALREEVLAVRRATGTRPAPAGQGVLAAWAADGALGRHLARLRRELAARRALVVAAVGEAGHEVVGDRAGAHLVVPLPSADAEETAVARAAAAGVLVDGLAAFHLAAPARTHGVLVGWAAPTRTALVGALSRWTEVLRGVPGRPRGGPVGPA